MERGEEFAERTVFSELREGVDVFREALAAVAQFTIGSGNIGMSIVDVAGKQNTRMNLCPVTTHLLHILLRSVEVRDLICSEHIVNVLGKLGFERRHHRKLLPRKYFYE